MSLCSAPVICRPKVHSVSSCLVAQKQLSVCQTFGNSGRHLARTMGVNHTGMFSLGSWDILPWRIKPNEPASRMDILAIRCVASSPPWLSPSPASSYPGSPPASASHSPTCASRSATSPSPPPPVLAPHSLPARRLVRRRPRPPGAGGGDGRASGPEDTPRRAEHPVGLQGRRNARALREPRLRRRRPGKRLLQSPPSLMALSSRSQKSERNV